jgi:hypothetical protein
LGDDKKKLKRRKHTHMKFHIKKTMTVLLAVLLVTTVCVGAASAKTANKDLPSKYQVLSFVSDYQGESHFVDTVSKKSEHINPKWTWDIWQDSHKNKFISFYYRVGYNSYGSIYFNNYGDQISAKNLKLKLVKSYWGR